MMTAKKTLFICSLKRLVILGLSAIGGLMIYPAVTADYAIEAHLVWGLLPMASVVGILVARDMSPK